MIHHQGNANQNDNVISHTCRDGYQKKKGLRRMLRNWNPCTLLVGMQNCAAAMKSRMEFSQKIETLGLML